MESNPGRDMWLRLASLRGCCYVKIESIMPPSGRPPLHWRVVVAPLGQENAAVATESESIFDAINAALDQADAAGWHRL